VLVRGFSSNLIVNIHVYINDDMYEFLKLTM
jgi:hypothetical protein